MQPIIKAKKSLGQNFLIDKNIINKIIKLTNINNNHIVEIGPGTGSLTKAILNKNPKSLFLIEKDQKLANHLKKEFIDIKKLKIFNEDILKFNLEEKIKKKTIIIGNLPYNISSQILAKLIKFKVWPPNYSKLILMFQKEVAEKISAQNKSAKFGRLTVLVNSRLKVTESMSISENSFRPIPKVKSTILVFEPIKNQDFKVKNIFNLEIITHAFFSKKRKMINKVFKKLFNNPKLIAEKIKINLNLRPNKVSDKQYYKITEYFEKEN